MSDKTNKAHQVKTIRINDMNPEDIPIEGSLGLLAAGYKGIMLWRNRKKAFHLEMLEKRMAEEKGQDRS